MSNITTSVFALIGGLCGLYGVQKKSGPFINYYRMVKAMQVLLAIASAVVVITDISNIAPYLADEYIEDAVDEAKAAGLPPPDIDRVKLIQMLTRYLLLTSAGSIIMWSLLGGYGLYIIHSLSVWYKRGSDPSDPQFTVSIPEPGPRIQYATPLLQGQSTTIPISQSV